MIIKLNTNIEIEECKRKINAAIDTRPFSLFYKHIEIAGRVRNEKLWHHKRTINYRNPLIRIFYGRIRKDDKGSVIEGSFKTFLLVKIVMAIYFAGVALIGGFLLVSILHRVVQDNFSIIEVELILGLLAAMLMLLIGILLYINGAKLREKEEEYLIMFLKDILNANKIE